MQRGSDTADSGKQVRNQLGTPGVATSFLRGAQIFKTVSNSFQLCSTHFFTGAKNFVGGLLPPGYGPGGKPRIVVYCVKRSMSKSAAVLPQV